MLLDKAVYTGVLRLVITVQFRADTLPDEMRRQACILALDTGCDVKYRESGTVVRWVTAEDLLRNCQHQARPDDPDVDLETGRPQLPPKKGGRRTTTSY